MPIFEYTCQQCKKTFEKLVLSKSQPTPTCPGCGSKKTRQQFSTFATSGTPARTGGRACAPSGGG
ncbi:MAG: zinc ribbon domain-containing protein [Acidobacteria bacterium]|nr:MAG: zinc ribbon domain-containing protein [Acidobacteriota bacterium]